MSFITEAKWPCYGLLKIKPGYLLFVTCICFRILWQPADSNECHFGWVSNCCNWQRGSRNKLISPVVHWFCSITSMAALPNPFRRGSRGWGVLNQQNHTAGGGNGSIMVGMFVCLCLANQKPSEREFFVHARTDIDFKRWMKSSEMTSCTSCWWCRINFMSLAVLQPIFVALPCRFGEQTAEIIDLDSPLQ